MMMRFLAIAGAALLGAILVLMGVFGARYLTPGDDGPQVASPAASSTTTAHEARLDQQALGELLAVVGPAQREQILASEENFAAFLRQETLNQAVLAAAYANGADRNEAIATLMERAGQRVLVETYLNQVVNSNLDPAFPSPEQVREAYDKNPDAFRVPQRVHLWQIYVPLASDADEATRKRAWALAESVAADLRAGKATFEAMAKKHSAHQPSRLNDGYMGLINVSELLPPVAEAALALEIGGISKPIATETGLHILKRGPIVEADQLAFEAVAEEVRERLRREAMAKVRQAALEKIAEEYPVAAPAAEDAARWRRALQDERPAGPDASPAPAD